jgi:hypothetical protein
MAVGPFPYPWQHIYLGCCISWLSYSLYNLNILAQLRYSEVVPMLLNTEFRNRMHIILLITLPDQAKK